MPEEAILCREDEAARVRQVFLGLAQGKPRALLAFLGPL